MNGLVLNKILKEKKMSGTELARKVGTSQPAISDIVKGKSFPRLEMLKKIATALDVDIKDLFESTKEEEPSETIYIKKDGEFIPIGTIKI